MAGGLGVRRSATQPAGNVRFASADRGPGCTSLSELITNGFVHGHGDVGVQMWSTTMQLCINVSSSGPQRVPMAPIAVDLLEEGGRGLMLVDAHADAWGIVEDGPLTRTWCAFGSGADR
ncbi:ATP-binding protein [Streptomyces sp. NPDC056500]|uniref:ATP-binding protein n=1 Tax=Streptomyces sp. NPDC056500 TaxID=3345840 RepID=UPI0036753C19